MGLKIDTGPRAEGVWLWRRLYVFLLTAALVLLLHAALLRVGDAQVMRLAEGVMQLLALTLLLYLVAPTAQQLVSLLAALRLRLEMGRRR